MLRQVVELIVVVEANVGVREPGVFLALIPAISGKKVQLAHSVIHGDSCKLTLVFIIDSESIGRLAPLDYSISRLFVSSWLHNTAQVPIADAGASEISVSGGSFSLVQSHARQLPVTATYLLVPSRILCHVLVDHGAA